MASLTVLQGPDRGRVFKTTDDATLIGRSSNVVPLTDNTVSRRHAQLVPENGRWLLVDLNSINGTFLNGQRIIDPIILKHGDQIRIGSTVLVYAGEGRTEDQEVMFFPGESSSLDTATPARDPSILSRAPSSEDSVIIADQRTAEAVRSWRVMQSLIQAIGSVVSADQLLERVMDTVFDEVHVDHGFILMKDEESGELLPQVIRRRTKTGTASSGQITTSETIVKHVVSRKEGILCANAQADRRFAASKESSIHSYGLRSVICVPIMVREEVLGVIHVDSASQDYQFTDDQLRLMVAIGRQTAMALENLKLLSARMQTERLAATGETVAYLSHYIKNILQGLRAGADMVDSGLGKQNLDTVSTGWPIVQRNLDKIYNLTVNMLAYSKDREPNRQMVQLSQIVREVVELVQRQADEKQIMLLPETDVDDPPIPVDPDGVHQVAMNLITNALDAVERKEGIINVRIKFDEEEQEAVLVVEDNGPGIAAEELPHIFEAFHSTKGQAGTGLGLAVARKIVHEHNGRIEVSSTAELGTTFRVRLPIAQAVPYESEETFGPR